MQETPVAADSIAPPAVKTIYPPPFASLVEGREKKKLGDFFGLANFGVNLTRLEPGAVSALPHRHALQDEFIYVLEGSPTLILDDRQYPLKPGDCMGFKAGNGVAHQLANRTEQTALYLEVGDRSPGDEVEYPYDDLKAIQLDNGVWQLTHKDGTPY